MMIPVKREKPAPAAGSKAITPAQPLSDASLDELTGGAMNGQADDNATAEAPGDNGTTLHKAADLLEIYAPANKKIRI